MKTRKLGEYYFGRHYRSWGIWQVDFVGVNGATSGRHIKDVNSYQEALEEVFSLNHWGTPKYIKPCVC